MVVKTAPARVAAPRMTKPKSKSVLELAHLPKDEQQRALIPAAIANPATMATAVRLGCEADFSVFACYAWNIAVPGVPRVWGKHHALICQALQALFEGQIPNNALMINLPPRHTKSTLASVLFPPWIWIKNPAFKILCSSMKGDLASRDAVNSRRLLESDWYRGLWQNVKIADDQGQKQRYQTTAGGHRVSVGVGVGTGDGGGGVMCFPYSTAILTDTGPIFIGRIVDEKIPVRVKSFDHVTGRPCFNKIERYERFSGRESLRARFGNGSIFECTKDHPVYVVERGYTPAASLRPGDVVIKQSGNRTLFLGSEAAAVPDMVYNIRVAKDHNYFAGGILVHNCDDPSDIDDTDRETPLSEAVNWWNNTMSTRLDDYKNGWRMLVGQRIDCNDLFGNQIEIGGWSRLTLPAEYEPGQHSRIVLKNGNVIEDFRRIEGEPLWPERFGREELDKLKRGRSADSWLSLYQQRPNRQGGGAAFVDFNPDIHKKPCSYDPALPICFSMDFNVNPFCCGVIQHRNGEVRVIREIELHGSETNKMCEEFLRIANQEGWKLVDIKVYGDPAGNQRRTSAGGETDWSIVQNILGKYMAPWGLRIKNSTISVKNTVNAVRTRIRDASGVSHLLIDPQCSGLISNLLKATWPCRENLEPYHHLSWFRYFCDYEYSPVVPWSAGSMSGIGASSH